MYLHTWRSGSAQQPPAAATRTNPDAGLTDAQRRTKYDLLRSTWETKCNDFIQRVNRQSPDLRSAPRIESMVDYLPPAATIEEAVRTADLIVVGKADTITYRASGSALTTFVIEENVKGRAGASVLVKQLGGPEERPGGTIVLVEPSPAPLLLPGDRAVLFLY